MNNYPDGVTGAELQIAGPDSERSTTREVICTNEECDIFEETHEVDGEEWTYRHNGYFDWKCDSCGSEYQEEFDAQERYAPDPDDLRDALLWD